MNNSLHLWYSLIPYESNFTSSSDVITSWRHCVTFHEAARQCGRESRLFARFASNTTVAINENNNCVLFLSKELVTIALSVLVDGAFVPHNSFCIFTQSNSSKTGGIILISFCAGRNQFPYMTLSSRTWRTTILRYCSVQRLCHLDDLVLLFFTPFP